MQIRIQTQNSEWQHNTSLIHFGNIIIFLSHYHFAISYHFVPFLCNLSIFRLHFQSTHLVVGRKRGKIVIYDSVVASSVYDTVRDSQLSFSSWQFPLSHLLFSAFRQIFGDAIKLRIEVFTWNRAQSMQSRNDIFTAEYRISNQSLSGSQQLLDTQYIVWRWLDCRVSA